MKELIPAIPTGGTLGDLPIHESKGAALVDAQRAFFGTHRPVQQRILWTLSKDHDPRVEGLMDWITKMQWALAKHGVRRFLDTRKRGALVVNAGYISPYHPSQPVFDWMTFDRAQVTGDRILQESIATYDPATTTVVFVFLVSDSYASAAMWRRLLTLPPSIQLSLSIPIESVKAELKKKTHVIHVK
ncbi:hypothetical protein DL93DRAFT_2063046 [Clavulina sp. PMI_390]|nr:hypothetical protein DL93DRAFT_2063046 [Clavulina sp. PMI_390]